MEKDYLERNEGPVDRGLRVAVGIVGLSLVFIGPKTMLGLFGLIPLVTGAFGICPLYTALGIRTDGKTAKTA